MITVFKIFLVAILLLSMILVLLMIGHIANPRESASKEERDRLLHDLETRDRVITSNSIFHSFFARSGKQSGK